MGQVTLVVHIIPHWSESIYLGIDCIYTKEQSLLYTQNELIYFPQDPFLP